MAAEFNMVEIWAKFSKSCKLSMTKANIYFLSIFVDILIKKIKKNDA
jgi:hypothetical protein